MTRYLLFDSYGLVFLWGVLSDERIIIKMGLSVLYAAGPCQRSLSQVRAPSCTRPYFTVSDLRLPFSSPPTTRRVTVEVFDPASTRCEGYIMTVKVKVTLRLTVSQSVSLDVEPHVGLMTRYLLLFDSYGLVFVGRPIYLSVYGSTALCWTMAAFSVS
jgi:hypothetical protein